MQFPSKFQQSSSQTLNGQYSILYGKTKNPGYPKQFSTIKFFHVVCFDHGFFHLQLLPGLPHFPNYKNKYSKKTVPKQNEKPTKNNHHGVDLCQSLLLGMLLWSRVSKPIAIH